jgi:hypothetical protein
MNSWRLTDEHINNLQVADVDEIIKRAKQAHFVNIQVRINGTWEQYEGDWIKHLKREGDPIDPKNLCQHDLLLPNPTLYIWVETNLNNIMMQMARCLICDHKWEWPINTAQQKDEATERIRQLFHGPKADCPLNKFKDECHLNCCGEGCEGEGCATCGPDV